MSPKLFFLHCFSPFFLFSNPPSSYLLLRRFYSSASLSLLNDDPLFQSPILHNRLHQKPSSQQHHHRWKQTLIAQTQKREHLFSLLKSCSLITQLLQIHAQFIRTNFIQHPRLSLKFLAKVATFCPQNMLYLCRIFSQLLIPDVSHYNVMILAFSRSDSPDNGIKFYRRMRHDGLIPDMLTLSFCLKCCAKNSALVEGMQIHGRMLVDGHSKDSVLMTTLLDLYSLCGRCGDACKVFDDMPDRDTVACNVMISCLMHNQRTRDALSVFDTMQNLQRHCSPDDITCLLLLQACADLGALDFGRRVRDYIERQGYGESLKLNNTLITMYSKCGYVNEAYNIFKRLPTKNLVSWSAMISGLGMNGYGHDAIEMFWEMQKIGIAPDDKVFTGVLYACSHSGLLDEGLAFFDKMIKEFGVHPNIHHYGCVVDILGRAGLLNQAYDLIISMKAKPDAKIWRTLLAACRIHRNIDLAEQVIEHIVELKAQEAGDYVLLMNTYSSNGKWDKMRELRKFMKENSIITTPGCSTLELKGVVHEFVADDFSHPRKGEIYEMLQEIKQQLKMAGYVSELSSELHNLQDEEKGIALSYHSEKLAIAFAVLATPPGMTIRVANSLRTCADCHNFAKVLSDVYNRKVIIRDRNRLHHFREGQCSCGDFW